MTAAVSGDTAVSVAGGDAAAVCVIGAGAAGLAAGRLLRDEGLRVTILEKSQHLGGVWRYHAGPGEEKAPMCKSVCFPSACRVWRQQLVLYARACLANSFRFCVLHDRFWAC